MHSACRPLPVLAANFIGELSRVSVRLVPGIAAELQLPIPAGSWKRFIHSLEETAHSVISDMIVMRPSDRRRARLMFLALDSRRIPLLFVKLTRNPPNSLADQMLKKLDQLEASFWYPRARGSGTLEDDAGVKWWYSIDEPMPQGPHWPARLSPAYRRHVAATISQLAEPPEPNLFAIHGDLAPWNVRQIGGGRRAIIDWENATWAPAGADEMWHAVTHSLIGGTSSERVARNAERALRRFYSRSEISAAAAFWIKERSVDEPAEVVQDIARSRRLMAFERRLGSVLTQLRVGLEAV